MGVYLNLKEMLLEDVQGICIAHDNGSSGCIKGIKFFRYTIDQKQLENVEYFSYVGSAITNDARCTREIKSRIAIRKATFNKKTLFTSKFVEETNEVQHLEHSIVWY